MERNNPDIHIATIGKNDTAFYGDIICNDKLARFEWDIATDGLRLYQNTRFLKKEVAPAEEFFIHKDAVTDVIVKAVDEYREVLRSAMIKPLDELIVEAGGSVEQSYKPLTGEPTR